MVRDPHQFVNELDAAAIERLIDRLESRAKDAVFTRLFDKYAAKLNLPSSAQVLEVGCGTGVIVRSLARRQDFTGTTTGIDQSPTFIEAARRFAQEEGVSDRVVFQVGDAHGIDFEDGKFDSVIAHTLISHVTDPRGVIREMARVTRSGGMIVIFDGDYASLTYAFPDHDFGQQMDKALALASFKNPLIIRDLPRLLPEMGLEIVETLPEVVAETGGGSYFKSFAETYAPLVASGDLLPAERVADWLATQRQAIEDGTFFASCNYYTYLLKPS
jgi:2-polyprenyl-3-methyl-5-hydroxy-6-metoxy-1,4-benzoquinol methylase